MWITKDDLHERIEVEVAKVHKTYMDDFARLVQEHRIEREQAMTAWREEEQVRAFLRSEIESIVYKKLSKYYENLPTKDIEKFVEKLNALQVK